jgi:hypothetical protein
MQLYNATASLEAPLHFPPNAQVHTDQLPGTKRALLTLGIPGCQAAAHILELPALPTHATVAQQRQQIIDFLGCAMTG